MKFKIKKGILLEKLNVVSKAISTKNIIPILSGIKFELFTDKLVLTASDNDITIQTVINAGDDLEIIKTGSIVIKGKYILDIIRKLDCEFVNIELLDECKILIYADNSEFNLNGIDAKEFPVIDLELSTNYVNLSNNDFRLMIQQTNYASSQDEARVVLTGVNIKLENDFLECSATDSYRLALKKIKVDGVDSAVDIIIPSKNLSELIKILPEDGEEDIKLYIFGNKIILSFSDIIFQSRLINGNYPNTKNLIPSEDLFKLVLNKNDFYNMVDRASVLNNDRDNNVITLEINNGLLKITSTSLEIGRVEEKMNVNCNDNIRISFSSKYMMDAIKTMKSDNIVLTFVGDVKPILLNEEDNDLLTCLILPIRTY